MLDPTYKKKIDIINRFNIHWDKNYPYVEKIFTDQMVLVYCERTNSITVAANLIYDWSLASGNAEVIE